MSKRIGTLAHRLWSRIERRPSGCWEWTGYVGNTGYGQIGLGPRAWGLESTHRVAWMLHHQEEIPEGLVVRHSCDNRTCCNPWHLSLGTHADNGRDRDERGRTAKGEALPQTKLTDREVAEIRQLWADGFPQWHIAEEFGITQGYVSAIVNHVYRKAAI